MTNLFKVLPEARIIVTNQLKIAVRAKLEMFYYGKIDEKYHARLVLEKQNERAMHIACSHFADHPDHERVFYKILGKVGKCASIIAKKLEQTGTTKVGNDFITNLAIRDLKELMEEVLGEPISIDIN